MSFPCPFHEWYRVSYKGTAQVFIPLVIVCLRYILRCRRIDHVPTTTLRRSLNLRLLPPVLLQRRLRWLRHVARRLEGELIRDVLLPPSFPNWRKHVGGQLKMWPSTIKDDLVALSGPQVVGLRRWNRDWLAISSVLAQDHRTWATMVRDAVLAWEEVGSTRPGRKPIQVKSSLLCSLVSNSFLVFLITLF